MKDLLDIQIIPKGIPANNFSADNFNNFPLAYAYVPYQRFEEPYDKERHTGRCASFGATGRT